MFTWLFFLVVVFFEEIEFTANVKILMQVFPYMVAMQKFHASCMDGRFLVPPVITAQMPAAVLNILLNY